MGNIITSIYPDPRDGLKRLALDDIESNLQTNVIDAMSDKFGWYVLRSKPNKEEFLWGQVLAHQVETYYPSIRAKVVNPRARKVKPYFPGYLFVHVDIEEVPQSLWNWLPGSRGLVAFGETPACVPDAMISAIQRKVTEMNESNYAQPAGFKQGESVSIQSGPFSNYEAIFDECVSGNDRVRVLLKHLRDRMIPVELPAGQIERKM